MSSDNLVNPEERSKLTSFLESLVMISIKIRKKY